METEQKWSADGTCVVRPEGDKDYYTKRWIADCRTRDLAAQVVNEHNSHDGMLRALKHAIFSDHFHDPDCCEECKKTESLLTQIAAAEGRNG